MNNTNKKLILIYVIMLFSFFESFSVFNFDKLSIGSLSGFGLQFSWFVGIILICIYIMKIIKEKKITLHNIQHLETKRLFLMVLFLTIIDNVVLLKLKKNNYVVINSYTNIESMISRSRAHLLYIFLIYLISSTIYLCLRKKNQDSIEKIIKRYYITVPFFFICIWGIYQWLSTFDLFEYNTIFNNNISTGFTYLRFKNSHRTCSVFPEPSEYAYFLGFFLPIVVAFVFGKESLFCIRPTLKNKFLVVVLYLSQCLFAASFSLYAAFPIILLIAINSSLLENKKRWIFNTLYIFFAFVFVGVCFSLFGDRIAQIANGTDGSFNTRLEVFFTGIDYFKINPLTGIGYGAFRAMDHISGTLSFFGLIGTVVFLIFLYRLHKKAKNNSCSSLLTTSYFCFLGVASISNSVYELLPFWLTPVLIELTAIYKRG